MVDTDFLIHTLPNGIRLIHHETDSQVGHLGIIINAGSRDEQENEHGLAHFIEHSVFKGTNKRKAFHVLSRLDDVGGELNAYTTKEETALYATFLSEYYERAAELLGDILFNSTYPEKELEREKEVIFEEINSYKDSPSELIFDEFEELLFDGHPIARNILGTPENIKKFNRNSIFSFIKNNYHTNQMIISSVGNISFSLLTKLADRYFGIVNESVSPNKRITFAGYKPVSLQKQKNTFQLHCMLGNIAFDSAHPKRIAMVLLNNLLGGNAMNSRLNLALRERQGLAYSIESNYTAYSDTGQFNVYFGTDKENFEKAYGIIQKEFKLLREKQLGNLQLSKAKKQLIGQIAIATENREDLMLTMGKSLLLYNKVDSLKIVFNKIESISGSDILEAANLVLNQNKLSKLVYF